ncbi:MAG: polysaccharide deacetylase family protein [Campylobacteraceae bacterium]|jgi:peptidoglycan/xylan/chitin deacetylase (PgdA/CDA1 family)|nr:polysaccharide deacetylase family protein [Campylobacteraceae bacterium]
MRFFLLLCVSALYLFANAHIFLYHRFGDERYPSTSVSESELRKQFGYLKDNGYEVVPLERIVAKINAGEHVPEHWVALTIDDGYKSFSQNGLEVFKEFGYPFTMFVYVEAAEKKYPDFMDWDELKALTQSGGTLEFHSYSHSHTAKFDEQKLKEDFEKGLKLFKKHLDITPKYFSYPYGEFNENVKNIALSFGFDAIFNQNSGAVDAKSNIYDLDRSALVGVSDIKKLLEQKTLQAEWLAPISFPTNGILNKVSAKITTNATKAKLYVTDMGWRDVTINGGVIDEEINYKLTNERTRVILKIGNQISTKMLAKE